MTIWTLDATTLGVGPRYLAIAAALGEAVADGQLQAGARLPTHRDLADQLGVTVGTVTRAYSEAKRRGWVSGEVGRGTFVRPALPRDAFAIPPSVSNGSTRSSVIDLSLSVPPRERRADLIAHHLQDIADAGDLPDLLGYQPHVGEHRHRVAGAKWVEKLGGRADPEDVVVCAGVQCGLTLVFSTLASRGDVVFCEELSYPGIRWIAADRGLDLVPVAMDAEGILPDALAAAARRRAGRFVYCVPNLQNPRGGVLSLPRRKALAEVVRERDLILVEDDVFGAMLPDPLPPVSDLAPERGYYVTSLSKGVAPALRVGFVRTPPGRGEALAVSLRTQMWMVSPLLAEVASRLIESGETELFVAWKRAEALARNALARDILGPSAGAAAETSYHFWLEVGEGWRSSEFAAEALRRGVRVSPAETFAVSREVSESGVRVSVMAAETREECAHALRVLAEIREGPRANAGAFIL